MKMVSYRQVTKNKKSFSFYKFCLVFGASNGHLSHASKTINYWFINLDALPIGTNNPAFEFIIEKQWDR